MADFSSCFIVLALAHPEMNPSCFVWLNKPVILHEGCFVASRVFGGQMMLSCSCCLPGLTVVHITKFFWSLLIRAVSGPPILQTGGQMLVDVMSSRRKAAGSNPQTESWHPQMKLRNVSSWFSGGWQCEDMTMWLVRISPWKPNKSQSLFKEGKIFSFLI